jgi:CRISPR-associated protein Cas2
MARRFTLVSYDISDDRRRDRVSKVLLGFGDRVQYSVFCCALSPRERIQLADKLRPHINHREDQILFLDAGPVSGSNPEPELQTLGKAFQPPTRVQIV